MQSPIFIFSLPRAGSTLLQRMLAAHPEIASHAEPWILLPLCKIDKPEGAVSEYGYAEGASAISDFIEGFPDGIIDFHKELRGFTDSLYGKHCRNNERYFLDKTPRYYYIIKEIEQIYPDAKFVFLFRNPVHVMSSMINTWSNGSLKSSYTYHNDLLFGLNALSEGYDLLKSKAISVNYEELVSNPGSILDDICNYLDVEYYESMSLDFSQQKLHGRMGDPTGVKDYNSVSSETLNKWQLTFKSHMRKIIIKKYIESIDEGVLEVQGYSKKLILDDILLLKGELRGSFIDFVNFTYSVVVRLTKANIFFGKSIKLWASKKYLS